MPERLGYKSCRALPKEDTVCDFVTEATPASGWSVPMGDPDGLHGLDLSRQPPAVTTDPEAPAADALEQAFPVSADGEPEMLEVPHDREAPEADALDQARIVPLDEE